MTAPLPATIANEIEKEIVSAVLAAKRWFSSDAPLVIDLQERLEKLAKVNVASASVLRGSLAHLQGDLQEMERWLLNAERNLADPSFVNNTRCASLANLGFFSAAAELFNRYAVLGNPLLVPFLRTGSVCGAFSKLVDTGTRAVAGGLPVDLSLIERAKAAHLTLERLGVTEAELQVILDQCGEVLRAHRLFWTGRGPDFSVSPDPDEPGLLLEYRVGCSVEGVLDMNDELVDRCVEADILRPGVSVAFVSDGGVACQ